MTVHKTRGVAIVVIALLVAINGFAQVRASGFAGSWLRGAPVGADAHTAPTFAIRVALNDQTLAVEERSSATGPNRSLGYYRLEQSAGDRAVSVDRPGRTFTWLAPDRLEIHDLTLSPEGRKAAVTEVWELRDGGRVLRISRTLRSLDDAATKAQVRVSTFQRE